MRRAATCSLLIGLALAWHCARSPRSPRSFDQIRQMVAGKTAQEVETLLGKPDTTEHLLTEDERWIWWNYTVLDGRQYAPESRGQIVHLEVIFERPPAGDAAAVPLAQWRASGPFAVSYARPAARDARD